VTRPKIELAFRSEPMGSAWLARSRRASRQDLLEPRHKSVAPSGSQTHSRQATSGSSAPGQSRAGPYANNKAPTPCAPNPDRASRRSAGIDDRVEPPCRDRTNRKTVLARLPADPSCAAPADVLSTNGITDRESSQREFCNTIPPATDIVRVGRMSEKAKLGSRHDATFKFKLAERRFLLV
jgi:hypothetical protein